MNYRGVQRKRPLPPCPRCGQYSGERRQKADEDLYICICTSCGWHTRFFTTKSGATKQWIAGVGRSKEDRPWAKT